MKRPSYVGTLKPARSMTLGLMTTLMAPGGQINRRENWDAVNSQAMFLMWVDGDYA